VPIVGQELCFLKCVRLLAMRTGVIGRAITSVCPSVTFCCYDQTNEDTIVQFSASGRNIILVSGEVKLIWIFAGDHPSEGVKMNHPPSYR